MVAATKQTTTAERIYTLVKEMPVTRQRKVLSEVLKIQKEGKIEKVRQKPVLTAKAKAKQRILKNIELGMIEAMEIKAGRKKGLTWDEVKQELHRG